MPELHIITGSNGAGKSAVGPDYITKNLQIFNGDKLFQDKQKELWKQGIRAIKELKNTKMDLSAISLRLSGKLPVCASIPLSLSVSASIVLSKSL